MRISPVDNSSFGSNFKNNREMRTVFDDARMNYNIIFLKSAQAILGDGKDDIIELREGENSCMELLVNGELENRYTANDCILAEAGQRLIKDYAQKITGKDMDIEALSISDDEQMLIAPEKIAVYAAQNTISQDTGIDIGDTPFFYDKFGEALQKLAISTRAQIDKLAEQVFSESKGKNNEN